MNPNSRFLPARRLPPGFADNLKGNVASPAAPQPAATLLLLRKGSPGMETLLLRRGPRAGFIPGAYVFPGGRVEPEDGDRAFLPRLDGLAEARARKVLAAAETPLAATAFWVAALRETFEETGILLAKGHGTGSCIDREDFLNAARKDAPDGEALASGRHRLLAGATRFLDLVESFDLVLDASAVHYIGHWVTPECERRRFDTRFFGACVPPGLEVRIHAGEMAEALWLRPSEALRRNEAGSFPLVFPTLRTLEEVEGYREPRDALESLASRPVPRLLPVLSKAEGGIRFLVDR